MVKKIVKNGVDRHIKIYVRLIATRKHRKNSVVTLEGHNF